MTPAAARGAGGDAVLLHWQRCRVCRRDLHENVQQMACSAYLRIVGRDRTPATAGIEVAEDDDMSMDGEPSVPAVLAVFVGGLLGVALAIFLFTGGVW